MLLIACQLPNDLPIVILGPTLYTLYNTHFIAYLVKLFGSNLVFEMKCEYLMYLCITQGLCFIAYFTIDNNISGITVLQEDLLLL